MTIAKKLWCLHVVKLVRVCCEVEELVLLNVTEAVLGQDLLRRAHVPAVDREWNSVGQCGTVWNSVSADEIRRERMCTQWCGEVYCDESG
jgi:hypothetical protein